ncbi:FAD-dependent oxidoreductase [Halobacteriovorax marinus]|uniref:NADH:ubiquinone reductase (non-electrogenic) n=1 Tax=Halobacteriovorax marinus TaxID=97084 RepID=A0A1Y5FBV2_9BACT|nr:FAD-dependent oxidoreductase [Halobacteriovorax marinus]
MLERVVIIGGGFAGIAAAKALANTDFEVTIIDRKNHHLFQPLLYQVASAALSPADISVPIREVVSSAKNIKVFLDEVSFIDKLNNLVNCKSNKTYEFDHLIIATGARPFYFGNDDWKKLAPGLKTLEDALSIRNKVLKSFEECELTGKEVLNFVIVGAGPTGVELAGAFAEIAYKILLNDYKNFDASKTKVYLIEGGGEVLPSFSGKLSQKAKSYLEELGVIVLTDRRVSKIERGVIHMGDEKILSENIIWAAGNRASPLIDILEVKQDRMGRAIVESDLSLKNYPNIYILGDSAHFIGADNTPLPALAPVASQQGKHVARQLKRRKSLPFKYLDKGNMATIGNFKAVMNFRGMKVSGPIAWLAWSFIHILFLIDFRNRIMVFTQWAFIFFFKKKGVRIITDRE